MKDIKEKYFKKKYKLHCSICDGEPDRLDKILSHISDTLPFDMSRTQISQRCVGAWVNGVESKLSKKVMKGDELEVEFMVEVCADKDDHTSMVGVRLEDMEEQVDVSPHEALSILYEDECLLAVDKPSGLVVHPGDGNHRDTLAQKVFPLLETYDRDAFLNNRAGIVHRLDRDTSGVIVVAKRVDIHKKLGALFAKRNVSKTYLAIVKGVPHKKSGVIENYIARKTKQRKKFAVVRSGRVQGKLAITQFRVIYTNNKYSVLLCHPHTGRTHQIRVHMQGIGCPVVGDLLYSRTKVRYGDFKQAHDLISYSIDEELCPMMLHAYNIQFKLEVSDRMVDYNIDAPIPKSMMHVMRTIGIKSVESLV